MAREELQQRGVSAKLEEEIKIALVPKDPRRRQERTDGNSWLVQVVTRLVSLQATYSMMYKKYCESKGWTVSCHKRSEGAVGGFKEI